MNFKESIQNLRNLTMQVGASPNDLVTYEAMDGYTQELMSFYNKNKLDKGTYQGNAQDLKDEIDEKEPKITRSSATNSSSTTDVATSKAIKDTFDRTNANMGITQNGTFPLTSASLGKVYRATNEKLYKCIKEYSGTSISVPNANFEELSIFENSKKIKNRWSKTLLYTGSYSETLGNTTITLNDDYNQYDFLLFLAQGDSGFAGGKYKYSNLTYTREYDIGDRFTSYGMYGADDNAIWTIKSNRELQKYSGAQYSLFKIYGIKVGW